MTPGDKFILVEMEKALRRLQKVRSDDLPTAYHAVLGGCHMLRPATSETHAELLQGRLLALALWVRVHFMAEARV